MASIQTREGPRGTAYRVHYRDAMGHQVVKTFHRKADARTFKAQVEVSRPEDVVVGRVSLRQVFEELAQHHDYSTNTRRQQAVYIRAIERVDPQLFSIPVNKVTASRLSKVISGIDAPNMRRRCRVFLNQVLTFSGTSVKLPAVKDNTRAARMERSREQERPLETSEVEAILQELPERYRTMVTLMAYMGLRPGEAYGIQLRDYDSGERTVRVARAVSRGTVGPTKTGEERTLPLGGLADLVSGHIGAYGIRTPEAHLFTNDQGRIIHENTFRPIFTAAAKRAGIPNNVSPNSLRHHAAAFLIHRGASVLQVSKMLGHAKPSITLDVYAYLFSDSMEQVAGMLPARAPLPSAFARTP
jgi:integrase